MLSISFHFALFSIAEKVHDTMHTAFWDVLREDLASDPPRYEHIIKLIGEAKEVCFLFSIKNLLNLFHIYILRILKH
jgi:hypothetical protein